MKSSNKHQLWNPGSLQCRLGLPHRFKRFCSFNTWTLENRPTHSKATGQTPPPSGVLIFQPGTLGFDSRASGPSRMVTMNEAEHCMAWFFELQKSTSHSGNAKSIYSYWSIKNKHKELAHWEGSTHLTFKVVSDPIASLLLSLGMDTTIQPVLQTETQRTHPWNLLSLITTVQSISEPFLPLENNDGTQSYASLVASLESSRSLSFSLSGT